MKTDEYFLSQRISGLESSLKIAHAEMNNQIEKNFALRKEIDKLKEVNDLLSKTLQRVYLGMDSPEVLLIRDQLWKQQVNMRLDELENALSQRKQK